MEEGLQKWIFREKVYYVIIDMADAVKKRFFVTKIKILVQNVEKL